MKKPEFVKIPFGSTLEKMAQLFEVDKDYLKRYHNIWCDLDDLIELEIPKHLAKLFVPPKDKDYQTDLMSGGTDAELSPAHILMKNRLFHKEYGVKQTLYENRKEKSKISFLTEVQKTGTLRYLIKRKNIFINNKAPDLVSEQLADKLGNVFFPLEVDTVENGNLKQISNVEDIRKRWKLLKPDMSLYYPGNLAQKIIESIDEELQQKSVIQNRILGSHFYRLYFLPFRDYAESPDKEFDLYLPLFPFKNKVKYEIRVKILPKLSETGKLLLEIKGQCTDTRTFSEMMNGKRPSEEDKTEKCPGIINALYKFNKEDGSVYSIEAEITLESEDQKNLKEISFEMYQQ